jgi:hypothetical protein
MASNSIISTFITSHIISVAKGAFEELKNCACCGILNPLEPPARLHSDIFIVKIQTLIHSQLNAQKEANYGT